MRKSNDTRDLPLSRAADGANNQLGIGASQTTGLLLADSRRPTGEHWNEENREAISEYNARIAREGLPPAKYRTF